MKNSLKKISLLMAVIFTLTDLSPQALAAGISVSHPLSSDSVSSEIFSAAQVSVPEKLGTIEEILLGEKNRLTVIYLADAHAVPAAQKSLFNLIEFFQAQYGIETAALEGTRGVYDPSLFRAFPDKEKLKNVFESYLETGELSGAVAASVLGRRPAYFAGVEDWKLYEAGIAAFLEALAQKPRLTARINRREAKLRALKEKFYSSKALELDNRLKAWRKTQEDLSGLLKDLAKIQAPSAAIYPSLRAMLEALRHENLKDGDTLDREILAWAERVQPLLKTKEQISAFSGKLQGFKTQRVSRGEFALFLRSFRGSEATEKSRNNKIEELIVRQERLQKMQGSTFFKELQQYIREIKAGVFLSAREKRLDALDRKLELLRKLADLELSSEEWKGLKAGYTSFRAKREIPHAARRFYEISEQRDHAFFKNLHTLAARRKNNALLLIGGGFHVTGLKEKLQKEGGSLVVIHPKMETLPEENHYQDYMQGRVSWRQYFKSENGRIDLREAFGRAVVDKLLHQAPSTASQEMHGAILKSWRDQILHDLFSQGRISEAKKYTHFLDEKQAETVSDDQIRFYKDKWNANLERFLEDLRLLEEKNGLNEAGIAHLLSQPTSLHAYAIPNHSVPADWISPRARKPVLRSEARSADLLQTVIEDIQLSDTAAMRGFLKEILAEYKAGKITFKLRGASRDAEGRLIKKIGLTLVETTKSQIRNRLAVVDDEEDKNDATRYLQNKIAEWSRGYQEDTLPKGSRIRRPEEIFVSLYKKKDGEETVFVIHLDTHRSRPSQKGDDAHWQPFEAAVRQWIQEGHAIASMKSDGALLSTGKSNTFEVAHPQGPMEIVLRKVLERMIGNKAFEIELEKDLLVVKPRSEMRAEKKPLQEEIAEKIQEMGQNRAYDRAMDWLLKAGPEVTPYLIKAIQHQNPETRKRAVSLLGERKEAAAIPAIAGLISGSELSTTAALALFQFETDEADTAILEAIFNPQTPEGKTAYQIFEAMGGHAALKPQVEEARKQFNLNYDHDFISRFVTGLALGALQQDIPTALAWFSAILTHPMAGVQHAAIRGLGKLENEGREQAMHLLWKLVFAEKPSYGTLGLAARSLLQLKATRPVSELIPLLSKGDDPSALAHEILVAAGASAVPELITHLGTLEKSWDEKMRVFTIFGEIKDERSIEPLLGHLQDKSIGIRAGAAKALQKFGDNALLEQKLGADYKNVLKAYGLVESRGYADLAQLGAAALPALSALIMSSDEGENVVNAVKVLSKIRLPESIELLLEKIKRVSGLIEKSSLYSLQNLLHALVDSLVELQAQEAKTHFMQIVRLIITGDRGVQDDREKAVKKLLGGLVMLNDKKAAPDLFAVFLPGKAENKAIQDKIETLFGKAHSVYIGLGLLEKNQDPEVLRGVQEFLHQWDLSQFDLQFTPREDVPKELYPSEKFYRNVIETAVQISHSNPVQWKVEHGTVQPGLAAFRRYLFMLANKQFFQYPEKEKLYDPLLKLIPVYKTDIASFYSFLERLLSVPSMEVKHYLHSFVREAQPALPLYLKTPAIQDPFLKQLIGDALARVGPYVGANIENLLVLAARPEAGIMTEQEKNRILMSQLAWHVNADALLPQGLQGGVYYRVIGYRQENGPMNRRNEDLPSVRLQWLNEYEGDDYRKDRYTASAPEEAEGFRRAIIEDSNRNQRVILGYLGHLTRTEPGLYVADSIAGEAHFKAEGYQVYKIGKALYQRPVKRVRRADGTYFHVAPLGLDPNLSLAYYEIVETGAIVTACVNASALKADAAHERERTSHLDQVNLEEASAQVVDFLTELRKDFKNPSKRIQNFDPAVDLAADAHRPLLNEESIPRFVKAADYLLEKHSYEFQKLAAYKQLVGKEREWQDIPGFEKAQMMSEAWIELLVKNRLLAEEVEKRFSIGFLAYELPFSIDAFTHSGLLKAALHINQKAAEKFGAPAFSDLQLQDQSASELAAALTSRYKGYMREASLLRDLARVFSYNETSWAMAAVESVTVGIGKDYSVSHYPVFKAVESVSRVREELKDIKKSPYVTVHIPQDLSQSLGLKGRTLFLSEGGTVQAALETLGINPFENLQIRLFDEPVDLNAALKEKDVLTITARSEVRITKNLADNARKKTISGGSDGNVSSTGQKYKPKGWLSELQKSQQWLQTLISFLSLAAGTTNLPKIVSQKEKEHQDGIKIAAKIGGRSEVRTERVPAAAEEIAAVVKSPGKWFKRERLSENKEMTARLKAHFLANTVGIRDRRLGKLRDGLAQKRGITSAEIIEATNSSIAMPSYWASGKWSTEKNKHELPVISGEKAEKLAFLVLGWKEDEDPVKAVGTLMGIPDLHPEEYAAVFSRKTKRPGQDAASPRPRQGRSIERPATLAAHLESRYVLYDLEHPTAEMAKEAREFFLDNVFAVIREIKPEGYQQEIAAATGATLATVHHWEKGNKDELYRSIQLKFALKLAEYGASLQARVEDPYRSLARLMGDETLTNEQVELIFQMARHKARGFQGSIETPESWFKRRQKTLDWSIPDVETAKEFRQLFLSNINRLRLRLEIPTSDIQEGTGNTAAGTVSYWWNGKAGEAYTSISKEKALLLARFLTIVEQDDHEAAAEFFGEPSMLPETVDRIFDLAGRHGNGSNGTSSGAAALPEFSWPDKYTNNEAAFLPLEEKYQKSPLSRSDYKNAQGRFLENVFFKLHEQGKTINEIAVIAGRHPWTVQFWAAGGQNRNGEWIQSTLPWEKAILLSRVANPEKEKNLKDEEAVSAMFSIETPLTHEVLAAIFPSMPDIDAVILKPGAWFESAFKRRRANRHFLKNAFRAAQVLEKSQSDIARELNVSPGTVSWWKREGMIRWENAAALAKFLTGEADEKKAVKRIFGVPELEDNRLSQIFRGIPGAAPEPRGTVRRIRSSQGSTEPAVISWPQKYREETAKFETLEESLKRPDLENGDKKSAQARFFENVFVKLYALGLSIEQIAGEVDYHRWTVKWWANGGQNRGRTWQAATIPWNSAVQLSRLANPDHQAELTDDQVVAEMLGDPALSHEILLSIFPTGRTPRSEVRHTAKEIRDWKEAVEKEIRERQDRLESVRSKANFVHLMGVGSAALAAGVAIFIAVTALFPDLRIPETSFIGWIGLPALLIVIAAAVLKWFSRSEGAQIQERLETADQKREKVREAIFELWRNDEKIPISSGLMLIIHSLVPGYAGRKKAVSVNMKDLHRGMISNAEKGAYLEETAHFLERLILETAEALEKQNLPAGSVRSVLDPLTDSVDFGGLVDHFLKEYDEIKHRSEMRSGKARNLLQKENIIFDKAIPEEQKKTFLKALEGVTEIDFWVRGGFKPQEMSLYVQPVKSFLNTGFWRSAPSIGIAADGRSPVLSLDFNQPITAEYLAAFLLPLKQKLQSYRPSASDMAPPPASVPYHYANDAEIDDFLRWVANPLNSENQAFGSYLDTVTRNLLSINPKAFVKRYTGFQLASQWAQVKREKILKKEKSGEGLIVAQDGTKYILKRAQSFVNFKPKFGFIHLRDLDRPWFQVLGNLFQDKANILPVKFLSPAESAVLLPGVENAQQKAYLRPYGEGDFTLPIQNREEAYIADFVMNLLTLRYDSYPQNWSFRRGISAAVPAAFDFDRMMLFYPIFEPNWEEAQQAAKAYEKDSELLFKYFTSRFIAIKILMTVAAVTKNPRYSLEEMDNLYERVKTAAGGDERKMELAALDEVLPMVRNEGLAQAVLEAEGITPSRAGMLRQKIRDFQNIPEEKLKEYLTQALTMAGFQGADLENRIALGLRLIDNQQARLLVRANQLLSDLTGLDYGLRSEVRITKDQIDEFFGKVETVLKRLPGDFGTYQFSYEFKTVPEVQAKLEPIDSVMRLVLETYQNRGFMVGPAEGGSIGFWIDPAARNFKFSEFLKLMKDNILVISGQAEAEDLSEALKLLGESTGPTAGLDQIQAWRDLETDVHKMDESFRSEVREEKLNDVIRVAAKVERASAGSLHRAAKTILQLIQLQGLAEFSRLVRQAFALFLRNELAVKSAIAASIAENTQDYTAVQEFMETSAIDRNALAGIADQVFEASLARLGDAIEKKEVLQLAPVIFYSSELKPRLVRLIEKVAAAVDADLNADPKNFRFHLVFENKTQTQELLLALKPHLRNYVQNYEAGELRDETSKLESRVFNHANFSQAYGVFFPKNDWAAGIKTLSRRRLVQSEIPEAYASALLPELILYYGKTLTPEITAVSLRKAIPDFGAGLEFGEETGIRILAAALKLMAQAAERFAASA